MIDFHSHILPNMDDGSSNSGQSLEMLHTCAKQNINTIVATPHFYRNKDSVTSFLRRRDAAYLRLKQKIDGENGLPDILLGSEVKFFEGISRIDEINRLCIGESRCLLLEMPFEKWNWRTLNEVYYLLSTKNLAVIIAHVERYLPYKNNKDNFYDLIEMGAVLQINTSNFRRFRTRKMALDLLKIGDCFVLGTDCHNMTDRKPDFNKAFDVIAAKLGEERMHKINILSKSLLKTVWG